MSTALAKLSSAFPPVRDQPLAAERPTTRVTPRAITPVGRAMAPVDTVDLASQRSTQQDGENKKGPDLTPEQRDVIAKIATRERETYTHEAHQEKLDDPAKAAPRAVALDLTPGATPEETIAKAHRVRAAALAQEPPSAEEIAMAADARRVESEARMKGMQSSEDDASTKERTSQTESTARWLGDRQTGHMHHDASCPGCVHAENTYRAVRGSVAPPPPAEDSGAQGSIAKAS